MRFGVDEIGTLKNYELKGDKPEKHKTNNLRCIPDNFFQIFTLTASKCKEHKKNMTYKHIFNC